MAVLWPLMRIWRNTGICSGPGFSLESEGGISLVLCRWWLIPLVSRSSCGGRLLHGRVRCNPCGVAEEGWGGRDEGEVGSCVPWRVVGDLFEKGVG